MSGCSCSNGSNKKVNLLFACSGAANTGYLSDRIARALAKENVGAMTCLSAMGANLSGFVESAKGADKNILIDGCPVACGKKIFDNLGLSNYQHLVLTDFGVEKGKTVITDDVVEAVKGKVRDAVCCG
jgi:uncharacterized metal-binding protein